MWGTASAQLVVALLAANLALWQRTRDIEAIEAPGGMVAIALTAGAELASGVHRGRYHDRAC